MSTCQSVMETVLLDGFHRPNSNKIFNQIYIPSTSFSAKTELNTGSTNNFFSKTVFNLRIMGVECE